MYPKWKTHFKTMFFHCEAIRPVTCTQERLCVSSNVNEVCPELGRAEWPLRFPMALTELQLVFTSVISTLGDY